MSKLRSMDAGKDWYECINWLTRCSALQADHKANGSQATAFDLAYMLRDGVLLCNLLNIMDPGSIDMKDVNQKPQMAQFLCLRNIKVFLSTCSCVFGLSDSQLFEPVMLFDLSNFRRVLCTLSALSNCPRFKRNGIPGFSIDHVKSPKNVYKNLESAGYEEEHRRQRLRREYDDADCRIRNCIFNEGGYSTFYSYPQYEVYQNLCGVHLLSSSSIKQDSEIAIFEGKKRDSVIQELVKTEVRQNLCGVHLLSSLSIKQDSGIFGGKKRDYVIQELVETERNYTEVLSNLLTHFARPLSSLLRPEDSARIFFGLKELLDIHIGFCDQLCMAQNSAALAQIFLKWRKKFVIYASYYTNLTTAQYVLQEACTRNEVVNQEVIKCQKEANRGKFKLNDILSVPLQRVFKYQILLDKLIEETPREWVEDCQALLRAKEAMVDVTQYIIEVKCDSDTLDLVKDIQTSITAWDVPEDAHLNSFGRLLRDGELKIKAQGELRVKTRYVFVFEQMMLICKAGRADQYHYRETIWLNDYKLQNHTDRCKLSKVIPRWPHEWLLVHKQTYTTYRLYARTQERKQIWMKTLQDAMDNVNPTACRDTNHKFKLTTFDTPSNCFKCDKFLKGLILQGYKCETCHLIVHKQCIAHVDHCMPMRNRLSSASISSSILSSTLSSPTLPSSTLPSPTLSSPTLPPRLSMIRPSF